MCRYALLLIGLEVGMCGLPTIIDISDVDKLTHTVDKMQVVLHAPVEHLLQRNTIEPVSNRHGIIARETIAATVIQILTVLVLSVMLPIETGLTKNLTSFGVTMVKNIGASSDLARNTPVGTGVGSGLVGLFDDGTHNVLLFLHKKMCRCELMHSLAK